MTRFDNCNLGVYHVISRTALPGLPFKDVDKDKLLSIIRRYSRLFFLEILEFSLMGNHFHLVVRMFPADRFTTDELFERLQAHYGMEVAEAEGRIPFMSSSIWDR